MFDPKHTTMMTVKRNDETTKKSVRINDTAEDLKDVHVARLSRKLRRMKRKLLLDAVADDPNNSGYPVRSNLSSFSSYSSSNSSRDEVDEEEEDDNGGEMAYRR